MLAAGLGATTYLVGVVAIAAALGDPEAGFAPGLRAKLVAAQDYLTVAPKVVRVATDIPMPSLNTDLPPAPVKAERLIELAAAWGVAGAARRLVDAVSPA